LFRAEAILSEEIKNKSFRTTTEASPCSSKDEDKDLLEPDKLKVVVNLQKYQEETKAWRDPKVKPRVFNVGDLVLLWSPRTEIFGKLESKWVEPQAVMEKLRPGAYHLSDPKGKILEHSWNVESSSFLSLSKLYKVKASQIINELLSNNIASQVYFLRPIHFWETRKGVRFLMR
jgi:hypothetical protein